MGQQTDRQWYRENADWRRIRRLRLFAGRRDWWTIADEARVQKMAEDARAPARAAFLREVNAAILAVAARRVLDLRWPEHRRFAGAVLAVVTGMNLDKAIRRLEHASVQPGQLAWRFQTLIDELRPFFAPRGDA